MFEEALGIVTVLKGNGAGDPIYKESNLKTSVSPWPMW